MDQLSFFTNDQVSYNLPPDLLVYKSSFLSKDAGRLLLTRLKDHTPWTHGSVQMYGKTVQTPRLTAWYGDAGSTYQFSGNKYNPMPWTPELQALRSRVEELCGMSFNSVLLNYYRDGNDSVAWHSDNEKELHRSPIIASLSLGQERRFDVRNKSDHRNKFSINLESGSLLLMKSKLQEDWEHRIAKSSASLGGRVNLTFRLVTHSSPQVPFE